MTGGTALHQIDGGHDKCLLRAGRLGRARSGTRSLAGPTILRKSCNEASGRMSLSCMDDVVVVKRSVLRIPRGIALPCNQGWRCRVPATQNHDSETDRPAVSAVVGGAACASSAALTDASPPHYRLQYLTHSRRVAREPLETPRNPCPSDAAAAAYSTVRTLSIESHNDEGRHACQPTPRACPTTACAIADRSLRICRPV